MNRQLEKLWQYLDLTRVYTKPRGSRPDFSEPVRRPDGTTAAVDNLSAAVAPQSLDTYLPATPALPAREDASNFLCTQLLLCGGMQVILRSGATIENICNYVHKDFKDQFKYALVWGTSAKHCPQRVGLKHAMEDEDVCQLMTK